MRIPALVALLALWPGAAAADVLLSGFQHVGDGSDNLLEPSDPVTRAQMRSNPSYFYLSQTTVVTAIQINEPEQLDGQLQVFIDDMTTPLAGTTSGSCDDGGTCTYTLTTPLTLAAGTHTIFPDGGCSLASGFPTTCLAGVGENDFGISSITLVSAQITLSRTFNRRTHLGDNNDGNNDYGGQYYPDANEGLSKSFSFSLETSRVVTEVRVHRLRDVSASAASFAAVAIDGTSTGTLAANGDPYSLAANTTLAAGAHTLTVTVGVASGNDEDDISWDDIVLVMINNPATAPGLFNAVDVGDDAATGSITTKVAGAGVTVDLVALSGATPFTGYTGTLYYEIVDASSASGSCATWPAMASGSVLFSAADNGRKTVTIPYATLLTNARIRLYDAALALTSCSADNFAIRPYELAGIVVSHADSATPGTTENLATSGFSASTQPVHKAGRYFTIQATAYNSAGTVMTAYAGSPTLTAVASVLGSNVGTAGASGWTYPSAGTLRSDAAYYNEAGAVRLRLEDTTFAAIDADDPTTTGLALTSANFEVGRFIPDHFAFNETTPAQFVTQCVAGGFTYVGQAFTFSSTPAAQVVAVSSGGTTTTNYDGPLYKITQAAGGGALPKSTYSVSPATPVLYTAAVADPDNTFLNQGNGVSLFTLIPQAGGYYFPKSPSGPVNPFNAQVVIALTFSEGDGVGFDATDPGSFGVAGTGIPFTAGNEFRFGRLVIDSNHTSEYNPLTIPLRAEYFAGGFRTNTADNCTALALSDLLLGGNLAGPPDPPADPAVSLGALSNGRWDFVIAAPNTPGQITIEAVLGGMTPPAPWLGVGPTWSDNPRGVATFGLSNDRDLRIFQREVISD